MPRQAVKTPRQRALDMLSRASKRDACLISSNVDKGGYGRIVYKDGGRQRTEGAHRFIFRVLVDSLEPYEPVHHKCGVSACINPDHLQRITQAENQAEMLERTFYQSRIAELERALTAINPNHPSLTVSRPGGDPPSG